MIKFGISRKKKSSDLQQFEDMVALIYEDIYRFIYSIAKNKTVAEDAFQNTLMTAYKNFSSLNERSKFKSWMFTIARRETLGIIKKSQKELPSEDINLQIILNKTEEFTLPEELVLNKELSKVVVDAIATLKPKYREIVNLRYYNCLTFEEISQTLGVNVNTVRIRHMRAKAKIGGYLKKNYFSDDFKERKEETV